MDKVVSRRNPRSKAPTVQDATPGSTVGQTAQPMVSPPNPAVGTKGKVSAASPQPVSPIQPTEPITPAITDGGSNVVANVASVVVPNNPVSSNNPVALPE